MSEQHEVEQEVMPPPRPQRASAIRNLMPRLPERGHVKIGGLGESRKKQNGGDTYQLPVKYDHFKVTTLERGPDGNFAVDKALHEKLGLGDSPTELPIRLLYDDIDLNMQTRYACYAGKTLWCSGDGVDAWRSSKEYGQKPMPEPFKVQCPCHRQDPAYTGKDKCKINGRLSVMIEGAGGVGGIWVFRTTSYNSVTGLVSSLALLRHLTGGILANIPLKLRIQQKRATSPTDGSAVTIFVVSVEFAGDIEELQEMGHKIALGRATAHVSIANIEEEARRLLSLPMPANAVFSGDDPDNIVEEYYPEQNGELASMPAGGNPPPRPTREQFVEQQKEPEPEPIVIYEIVLADGVVEELAEDKLVDRLIEVFQESAKLGWDTWKGVGETNTPLLSSLKEGNEDQKGIYATVKAAYQECAPPKPEKTKKTDDKPAEVPPSERHELWSRESYLIEAPLKANRSINFQVLRDLLMDIGSQAKTPAELTMFIADNEPRMRQLWEYSADYEKVVQDKFTALGTKLAG